MVRTHTGLHVDGNTTDAKGLAWEVDLVGATRSSALAAAVLTRNVHLGFLY